MFTVTGYEKLNDLRLSRNQPRSNSEHTSKSSATREALDRLVGAGDEAVLIVDGETGSQRLFTSTDDRERIAAINTMITTQAASLRAAIFHVLDSPPNEDHVGWCFDAEDLGPEWTEEKATEERVRFADAVEAQMQAYLNPPRPESTSDRMDYIAGSDAEIDPNFNDKLRDDVAGIRQQADTSRIEEIRGDLLKALLMMMPTPIERVESNEPGSVFLFYREGAETVRYRVTITRD